ncbi:30S ribosomal protein S17 [Candidatus Woesearchaeota archaeon]|nr:30S ribosomal protein S17 [Candidatus Woesearchaeota archaeon]
MTKKSTEKKSQNELKKESNKDEETKLTKKTIGVEVKQPENKCDDKNCPFHSNTSLRGRMFKGKIVGGPFHRTVTVEWGRRKYIPKYERYEKRRTRVKAHSTPCIEVKKGDNVAIMETRPLSKTKKFVIIEKNEETQNESQ